MKKLFHINAHHPYSFSPGKYNQTLTDLGINIAKQKGYETQQTKTIEDYDIEEEIKKHQWADIIILQAPVNWMSVSWSCKKYMDEIYTAGMDGRLCNGDGRSTAQPQKNYGAGGTLTGKKYMLSLTFNAPEQAFNNRDEYLFQGKQVDDLFFHMHMNFRFFNMTPLATFACYDIMKCPQAEQDFKRFSEHLHKYL